MTDTENKTDKDYYKDLICPLSAMNSNESLMHCVGPVCMFWDTNFTPNSCLLKIWLHSVSSNNLYNRDASEQETEVTTQIVSRRDRFSYQ